MTVTDVGYDPIKWIDRLREVAESSSFTEDQKYTIDDALSQLQKELYEASE